MAIHHATLKKAEKMGVILEEVDADGTPAVRAFWPKRSVELLCPSASDAMAQMQAVLALMTGDEFRIKGEGRLITVIRAEDGHVLKGSPLVPVTAHEQIVLKKTAQWEDPTPFNAALSAGEKAEIENLNTESDDERGHGGDADSSGGGDTADGSGSAGADVERAPNGVALDGGVAYREGTPAGDCPYSSETDDDDEYANFERWNEEWDAAADEASEEEGEKGGSVVNEKYRAIYAERGHPTHCGDWLANLLNNLCLTGKTTDLNRFEAICEANGVDMSKYNRTTPGWQGRFRMTGRNLLAKRIYLAGGVIKTPVEGAEAEYRAPADWMANQRYKMPKADQNKPIPTAPEAE